MRLVFLLALLFIVTAWFFMAVNGTSSRAVADPNAPIYERYKGNTVEKPDWPKEADEMVLVKPGNGVRPYYIDKYEAVISRRQAWSLPGQTPTTKLTGQDARDACLVAGKRLCTTNEWRIACRDGGTRPVSFKKTDVMLKSCDFGRSKGYDKTDHPNMTNSHPKCTGPKLGLHHMYGNVVEMTAGPRGKTVIVGMSYLGTNYYGQAFSGNPHRAMRMACEYTVMDNYPAGRYNEGMGFRCCKDAN